MSSDSELFAGSIPAITERLKARGLGKIPSYKHTATPEGGSKKAAWIERCKAALAADCQQAPQGQPRTGGKTPYGRKAPPHLAPPKLAPRGDSRSSTSCTSSTDEDSVRSTDSDTEAREGYNPMGR